MPCEEETMFAMKVNGQPRTLDVEPDMPLLWALRDVLDLKGTKFGCGAALCGACTVHIDGEAARSCSIPVSAVAGKSVTTIEGLAKGNALHPVQQVWLDQQVPQCGYCQPGMIMAVSALLRRNAQPSDADIDRAITNVCRCSTYVRIRPAIHAAAKAMKAVKA
jgi:isoquinoline 1-oxidoreductase subunit alpha